MAVYYATKNYVLAFSEALAEELDGSLLTEGPALSLKSYTRLALSLVHHRVPLC